MSNSSYALETAGFSARLEEESLYKSNLNQAQIEDLILKKRTLTAVFEKYNSPLVKHVDAFIKTCLEYSLDCYLLPSIAGIESGFAKHIPNNSYNPFGWGGKYFTSFDEAIDTVGKGLRQKYINRGADTIYEIGPIYCESNTWSTKVTYFRNVFEKEEENQLQMMKNSVELYTDIN